MRTPKRSTYFYGSIALMGLFAFGLFLVLRSSPSPLDRAQAVARTEHWLSERGTPYSMIVNYPFGVPMYYWSGDNDLTYTALGRDGKPHLFRRTTSAKGYSVEREGPALGHNVDDGGELSPDGHWFVEWHQNTRRQNVPTFIAMDGPQRHAGQPTSATSGLWTPDSATLICSVWPGEEFDLYNPASGAMQKQTTILMSYNYVFSCVDPRRHLIGFEEGSGIFHSGSAASQISQNYPFLKMIRADLANRDAIPEQWKVAVPEYVDHGAVRLSPSGDRLLWTLHSDTTPSLLRKLSSRMPALSVFSSAGYHWLVSGVHGEEMHEIAFYRDPPANTKAARTLPYARPCWLPDSKHISFIHQNTLYMRPVD